MPHFVNLVKFVQEACLLLFMRILRFEHLGFQLLLAQQCIVELCSRCVLAIQTLILLCLTIIARGSSARRMRERLVEHDAVATGTKAGRLQ